MGTSRFGKSFSTRELEALLSSTLVPVEPSEMFINRLRGSLVRVHGRKPFTLWTGLAVGASFLLVVAMSLGVVLRILLAGVGILNLLLQRRTYKKPAREASGGSITLSV